ncbi:23S rRNA (uracil(1939)-C(5))-methyltransferase RlmD [Facklamia miroungae]|uniref:23S rRNA (Uracil1939-C5)-methyltransferase n=1 Tax=Facklamia miroungae TaxID=120956 RepID=A0A1G7T773_9LACT|nr:23S rRNA (uracil(1939)-C(5))-methyltransferase RlmD [Facklamia miroungae]NKZ29692.1 23S rRNA (uracil(1939)-C(5))-methyltransferase RlmD [Facklamia miroungae]SDG31081.1 23S rRNA (uracil1939-C5)-methyltransferase [Facklamia miroungae]
MTNNFKKNQLLQAKVEDLTHEGMGVAKIEGFPFFIEGVLPQEEIEFKVIKTGKTYGFGKFVQIIKSSPDRVEMMDDLGRQTGTLTLQHLSYPAQLAFKQKVVKDAFERIGHFKDLTIQPTLGMEEPWGYRNKAQIPVRMVKGQLETGFYRKNSHDLIPVEDYHIQDPAIDQAILIVRDLLRKYHISAYDERSHKGCIRHLIIRKGHYSDQLMVILVTRAKKIPQIEDLIQEMIDKIPHLVSIIQNINPAKTNVIMGKETYCLWGQEYFEDQMLDMTFRISPQSFYQINTSQAERLYQLAIEAADFDGSETVLDAYCGIGTLSLAIAKHVKSVYAMELVVEAVKMAEQNAEINQINNVHFEAGSAEDWLARWNQEEIHFDVVTVDPPRKGLDGHFIDNLMTQDPVKIVYISCNPSTQARDCQLLAQAGYQIESIQPVDLFPFTNHVETIALIQRVKP